MKYIVYADGGARGNPGPAGAGVVIKSEQGETLAEISEYLGEQTNNYAEYMAVIHALETLRSAIDANGDESPELELRLDSELIIKQLKKEYRIKAENLKPLYKKVRELLDAFTTVVYTHVPREDNKEADTLANEAMDLA